MPATFGYPRNIQQNAPGTYTRFMPVIRMTAVLLLASLATGQQPREKRVERWAQREQNTIQVHPGEATFAVPEAWQSRDILFSLTRNELRSKVAKGGWGTQIADGALRLNDCAAQISPDNLNWMRVYVVNATEEYVLQRIREKGWKAATKIPNYVRGHAFGFQTVPAKEGPWTHVDIPYVLNFGDYSGGGSVSFYLRSAGEKELVIVFGRFAAGAVTPPDERQNVLKSVVVPPSGS